MQTREIVAWILVALVVATVTIIALPLIYTTIELTMTTLTVLVVIIVVAVVAAIVVPTEHQRRMKKIRKDEW
jgi:hypothetical protein